MWEEYVVHRRHAQSVYDTVLLDYYNSILESLSTEMHSNKWWSTLKTFLFGVNSSLPPTRTDGGSVTYDQSKKAEVFLYSFFQNKKSDQELNLPPTCFPKPIFIYFAFKSSEIKFFIKDVNPHGGLDSHNIIFFSCF